LKSTNFNVASFSDTNDQFSNHLSTLLWIAVGPMAEEISGKPEGSEAVSNVVGADATAERRVRRKLDLHMMPLFFVLCKCAHANTLQLAI
jgi:hypothetical protein